MLAPEPGSLGVGPAEFDVYWWIADEGVIAARACSFDDEYIFNPDGSFRVEYQEETWLEPWQSGGGEECGAPVAPHDGSIPATWSHDQEAGTLTIGGQGSFIGLPRQLTVPRLVPLPTFLEASPQRLRAGRRLVRSHC